MFIKKRWIFRLLMPVVLLLGSILACENPFMSPEHVLDRENTRLARFEGTQTAVAAARTAQAAKKENNSDQQSPQPIQQNPQPVPDPQPVQNPPSTEIDRDYKGMISVKYYLDSSDNTWKCDDSTLYAESFTLHFSPDGSIMMDNTQVNYTAIAGASHFQADSSLPGKFKGSDPSSADEALLFTNAAALDFSKLQFIETVNEPNGNPGVCSFEFTLVTGNP